MALVLKDLGSQGDQRQRFIVAALVIVVLFFGLLLRAWYLQILKGEQFRAFSEKNRITVKYTPAMRGRILDRKMRVIAGLRPSFDLTLTPSLIHSSKDETLNHLSEVFAWTPEQRVQVERQIRRANFHDPVVVQRDLSRDQVAIFMARSYEFPGVQIIDSPARHYPFGDHGSHFLGYLREIGPEALTRLQEENKDSGYRLGHLWGVTGVEKTYEKYLRGYDGERPFIEDARGREVGEELSKDLLLPYRRKEPVPGFDVVLGIDLDVQEAAEQSFEGESGAVVAMDPRTGDILALVSRPEFDPAQFSRVVTRDYWRKLQSDPRNPLYDRALKGIYPPASTFKIITGVAALMEKVTHAAETVFCNGFYRIGRETKRCWKHSGHGVVDYRDAMKKSCDVWFYEMGKRLGVDKIAQYSRMFGLGEKTGISINLESSGLIPTEEWKRKVYGEPWVGGETLSVAIGQGAVSTTPLQMAVAYSALVNGGKVLVPRMALRSVDRDGKVRAQFPIQIRKEFEIPPSIGKVTREGLYAVVNEPEGTAFWYARSKLVEILGKTGTAQVVGRGAMAKLDDHAWFIGVAPAENPEIVVAVIVEHGKHGSSGASPIARKVIEAYLGTKNETLDSNENF